MEDVVITEVKLREALYALNRTIGAFEDGGTVVADVPTINQLVNCRNIIWTAGVARFGWERDGDAVKVECAECKKKDAKFKEFKKRVRDRAIEEADRRGWCGEFDGIMKELGVQGRFGNYEVTVRLPSYAFPLNSPDNREVKKRVLAKSRDHAIQLVRNWLYTHLSVPRYDGEYLSVELVREGE